MGSQIFVSQVVFLVFLKVIGEVEGHGVMLKPQPRSTSVNYCGTEPSRWIPPWIRSGSVKTTPIKSDVNGTLTAYFSGYINATVNGLLTGTFTGTLAGKPINKSIVKQKVSGTVTGTLVALINGTINGILNGTLVNGTVRLSYKNTGYWSWRAVWQTDNPGKDCGVCGDQNHWNNNTASANEYGGKYGKSGPSIAYREGQILYVGAFLSNPHEGFWQCRICKDAKTEINNQSCFDQNLLLISNATGLAPTANRVDLISLPNSTYDRINILTFNRPIVNGWATDLKIGARMILPLGLSCDRCVIQFNYRSGRICDSAKGKKLCAQQETFRTCADIRIVAKNTPVQRLKSVGMSKNGLSLCLDPQNYTNSYLQINTCSALAYNQSVLGGQPWEDFKSSYAPIVFEYQNLENICLAVAAAATDTGTQIWKWTCNSGSSQKWMMKYSTKTGSTKTFQIQSALVQPFTGTTMCVKAQAPDKSGHQVILVPCDSTDTYQFWTLV